MRVNNTLVLLVRSEKVPVRIGEDRILAVERDREGRIDR